MRKRISVILLIVCLFLPALPLRAYAAGKYVASRNSDVYHYSYCSYVSSIYEKNKIWFDTAAEAEATGRRGCSRCKPSASTESPGTQTSKSQTKTYSKSDIDEAYGDGFFDGYASGREFGYDLGEKDGYESGYSDAMSELEKEYRKKVDEAASNASSTAYVISAFCGIPSAFVVCMALLNKQEKELKKKYGVSSSPKSRSAPASSSGSAPKSQPPRMPTPPPPAPKPSANPGTVIGPNPASGIRDMRFSEDAFIITFGDGKQYLYYNIPKYLGVTFSLTDNCLVFFKEQIDGVYPYMLVPD